MTGLRAALRELRAGYAVLTGKRDPCADDPYDVERLREMIADDRRQWPEGHPCRDCGRVYYEHPTPECDGWR